MPLGNAVNARVQGFQSLNTATGVWTGRSLTAGAGISITNNDGTGGNPVVSATAFTTWVTTAVNIATMTVFTGYFCITAGGILTLGLPAVSVLGDTIEVSLKGATSWSITQPNAGSQIIVGSSNSTLGVGGTVTSTAQGDSIRLVCLSANAVWVMQSAVGNFIIV